MLGISYANIPVEVCCGGSYCHPGNSLAVVVVLVLLAVKKPEGNDVVWSRTGLAAGVP